MKVLNLRAVDEDLAKLSEFIDEELMAAQFTMKQIMHFQLAAEEIFINICHYAYNEGEGKVEIKFEMLDDPERARMVFKDSGVPYNPLAKADPDVTLSAEDRSIGGLGIFLTKKTMDNVEYYFEDGCNVLILEKHKKVE